MKGIYPALPPSHERVLIKKKYMEGGCKEIPTTP